MTRLDEDYYLDICPRCGQNNEFLDEKCSNCGEQLHIFPTIPFMLDEDEE